MAKHEKENKMAGKAAETLRAYYPASKRIFEFFGRFDGHGKMANEKDSPYGVAITVLQSEVILNGKVMHSGSVALIDPRCLLLGEVSGVLYDPRDHYKDFPPEMKEWMESNPEWPPSELRDDDYVLSKWKEVAFKDWKTS